MQWTEVADWSMTAAQLNAESAQIAADVRQGEKPAVAVYRAAMRQNGGKV